MMKREYQKRGVAAPRARRRNRLSAWLACIGWGVCAWVLSAPVYADHYFASSNLQFSKREYAQRRERLCAAVADGVILIPSADYPNPSVTFRQDSTFLYFTGLEVPRSYLLLDAATRREVLYLPARDERFYPAGREHPSRKGRSLYADTEILNRSGLREVAPVENLERDLEGWVRTQKPLWIDQGSADDPPRKEMALGFFSARELFLSQQLQQRFPNVRMKNLSPALASLRMVKSDAELRLMQKAAHVGVTGMLHAIQSVRPGMYERALEGVLAFSFKRGGAQAFPVALTVKSGPNSALPAPILAANYDRRNRPMQLGELVIAQAYCELEYYTTGLARTIPVSGQFSEDQKEAYRVVLEASKAAIAAIRPGVTLKQIEEIALTAVPTKFRRAWERGIGHFIGLDVTDPSDLNRPLAAGMTLIIEPRLYIAERSMGVMVGDVVAVTATGCDVLTADAPKDPQRIEELIARRKLARFGQ